MAEMLQKSGSLTSWEQLSRTALFPFPWMVIRLVQLNVERVSDDGVPEGKMRVVRLVHESIIRRVRLGAFLGSMSAAKSSQPTIHNDWRPRFSWRQR